MGKKKLIAEKIKLAMKEHRLSHGDFAWIMGVQPSIVTRWLSGTHNFTIETLLKIEEKLKIELINTKISYETTTITMDCKAD